ncbi:MAG: prolyl-tRNA synthetase associated domain-containing protein [Clostridia bacterium]|nr:prolyl-tRNA synthetase associated domain-containing protein [Clostridia bacterium]MBR0537891.1 prolyl-tRNA synthetase associated domain-containing protein [Clostridia bacterium]
MFIDDTFFTNADQCAERDERVREVLSFLDGEGIPYRGLCHDEAATIELCEGIETALGAEIVKNLFLANQQKTAFYLLIMPGRKPFKTKYLSKQIGSARLSFGDPENMLRLLNVTPGSASIFSLLFDTGRQVRLLIDREIKELPEIGFHPCKNTATVRLKTEDVLIRFLKAAGRDATFVDLPRE